jgi:signal transduction histidine kinase
VSRLATVRVRVTVAAVLIVGVAMGIGGLLLVRLHRDQLTSDIQTVARIRSHDIAADLATGSAARSLGTSDGDGSFAQVVDSDGRVVLASPNIEGEPRVSRLTAPRRGIATSTVDRAVADDSPFRVVARRSNADGGPYTIYVARSLEPVEESENSLIRLLAFGFPVLLLVVGSTTWFVTGRALRPVEAIRAEVEAIGAEDLHRRVPDPATDDEIGRLARTMNAMLGRIEAATAKQRRFVADASHELRTPLTGIRTQLEVDLAHPKDAEWQTTEQAVLDDTLQLQRLVADLLTIASATSDSAAEHRHELVDLDDIVLSEARRVRSAGGTRVDTTGVSGAQVEGNPDELTRVVRNLVDNAARHATAAVTIWLAESDSEATLSVIDDGPGVSDADRDRIFERFARLDDARARDDGGTGLGLAIAHEIVSAHGGVIDVSGEHGACFTVRLPVNGAAAWANRRTAPYDR